MIGLTAFLATYWPDILNVILSLCLGVAVAGEFALVRPKHPAARVARFVLGLVLSVFFYGGLFLLLMVIR